MRSEKKNMQQQTGRNARSLSSAVGRWHRWGWVALLATLSLGLIEEVFAAEIQIVCNNSITVDSLAQKEIRKIFLGKTLEWANEEKVVIAIVKTKALQKDFLKEYVGMTPAKYRTYWKQMIFTGKSSSSPKTLATEDDLLKYVAETEGAIGYVSSDAQTAHVKVLDISK